MANHPKPYSDYPLYDTSDEEEQASYVGGSLFARRNVLDRQTKSRNFSTTTRTSSTADSERAIVTSSAATATASS